MKASLLLLVLGLLSTSSFSQDYDTLDFYGAMGATNLTQSLGYKRIRLNDNYGLLDQNDSIIYHPSFAMIRAVAKDRFVFRLPSEEFFGLLDADSNVILPAKYKVLDTDNHLNLLARTKKQSGIVSFNGDTLIEFRPNTRRYASIWGDDRNIFVREGRKYAMYSANCTRRFDETFQGFSRYYRRGANQFTYTYQPSLYSAKKKGKWFIINEKGEYVCKDSFDWVFGGVGVFMVEKNRKFGVLDTCGKWLIPPKYKKLHPIVNQGDRVGYKYKEGKKWGLFDKRGNEIYSAKFEYILTQQLQWSELLSVRCTLNGTSITLFNEDGEIINQVPYCFASILSGTSLIHVARNQNDTKLYGLLYPNGEEILPVEFNSIIWQNDRIVATKNDKVYYYQLNGNCIECPEE